ncbi:AAA-like domain-containing protein [Lyngbya confervoides]|uniref:AAA-like domain-containing protein n=1 Tax=Lyngbya confervoides BDU141951 TaxID=1574623 RepID=A0ABD4T859_9CYAN|nr:AAA-like domain-containing protein [Lyngbya confervoides]MCM1984772.1 AAA-like domain-containing protein [Lyngbya confervoides BDU141951]
MPTFSSQAPDFQTKYYKVGGCLGLDHPSYVTRQADHRLLASLLAGQFCYVFNCRQMGKSSLRVRAMHQLTQRGMSCASIDLSILGSQTQPQQWYGGIITQLFQGFSLVGKTQIKPWIQAHQHLSPVQQLEQFLMDQVLPHSGGRPLYIFIDEIDKILSLNFSADDLFALIRYFYNQRAETPALRQLTFALFGVATPSDLIQDKTQTLFNIGQAVELTGFSLSEVEPLAMGLAAHCEDTAAVLDAILDWTGGQPFLTQKLCQLVAQRVHPIPRTQSAQQIDTLVRSQLVDHWETQDEPVHLKTIRDRLLCHPSRTARLLRLYQHIWQQGACPTDDSPEQSELRLSGLVVQHQGSLRVSNRIYREIFDDLWIRQQLAQLRPYAEALNAWEESQRQDNSRLLRGQALQDALNWSTSQRLSAQDFQFLAASQVLDNQRALEQERRQREVERLATALMAEQHAKQALAEAYAQAKGRLRIASGVLTLSVLGAVIATGWLGYVLHRQRQVRVQALEWAGKSALSQFEFNQLGSLVTAMEAGEALQALVQKNQPLQTYPTVAPLTALQDILSQIRERNHLLGHQQPINGISLSPDGAWVATASRDGTAKLWTLRGQEHRSLTGHQGDVYGVSFSPDSRRLATASKDGTVKVWSLTGSLLFTLSPGSAVYSVSFSPDGKWIATAAQDGTAHLWTSQGEHRATLLGHQGAIYSIQFHPNSQQMVTASRDRTVKVWRLDGTLVRSRSGLGIQYSASFSPNGQILASAGQTGEIQLWAGSQLKKTIPAHAGEIYDVSFDPTGQFLATASADETVRIWSVEGEEITTFQGYQGAVYDVSFDEQGHSLATASHEKHARLWNLQHHPLSHPRTSDSEAAALQISPDGQYLITAFTQGQLSLHNRRTQRTRQVQSGVNPLYDLTLIPGQSQLAVAGGDGSIRILDFQGQSIRRFQAHQDLIYSVSAHPQEPVLATSGRDRLVKLWTAQGQLKQTLQGHQDAVYDVSFSPDGQWIATASGDKTIKLWSTSGQIQTTLKGHTGPVHQVTFSPNSRSLATASSDGTARLWTIQGEQRQIFPHDDGLVFRVAFHPQGQQLVTGSKDGMLRRWTLDGTLQDQMKGHPSLVMDVIFSPKQELISLGQQDRAPQIWPPTASAASRLHYLLRQGCNWLADYRLQHPQLRFSSCSP